MRPAIGAYFPCFRELTAANETLVAYRKYFPNNTVVMVNDAGDEKHALLGEKYNCKYFHETENIGYPGGRQHHEQIIRWVKRFLYYIQFIEDDWFFLLEDDVFIMKTVDSDTLKHDINGINPDNLLPHPSVQMVKDRGHQKDSDKLVYGAMGGAIFRTSFFKEMAIRIDDVVRDLNEFGEKCPQNLTGQNWYYSDVVVSFLTYLYGGTLGMYPEFAELWFSDLPQRLSQNQVGCLNQYKFLYKYPAHPHLEKLKSGKYTIVLPTRGDGPAFEVFVNNLLPRYVKYLARTEIEEFIIICPQMHLTNVVKLLREKAPELPFVFYSDETLGVKGGDSWMNQQIIKLAICYYIKTDHYFIIDDDLIITKSLHFSDFFDEKGKIYYSFESWPINGPNFATNTAWWMGSLLAHEIPQSAQLLARSTILMGVTPQLMITRIVHQLIHSLGSIWIAKMKAYRATEYSLYWVYLMRTLRVHYYAPNNKFFAMDNSINILVQGLSREDVVQKLQKGIREQKYTFLVAQSWLKYPSEWIREGLKDLEGLIE